MQDDPPGALLLEEVARALKAGIAPGFQQHVAANAIALAQREDRLAAESHAQEAERLRGLLDRDGSLPELNFALAEAIRTGAITLSNAALREHLVRTTIEKLEVDQPNYPAFRAWKG
jgi:hypothetical protein